MHSISATAYAENFAMDRCPVFFTYYIFTASIMHVTICEPSHPASLSLPHTDAV